MLCQSSTGVCLPHLATRCHAKQALGRRGVDVAYVGGSSSVLAVGGSCARGNVAIWDTLAPPAGGPVAALGTHTALVTALQVLGGASSKLALVTAQRSLQPNTLQLDITPSFLDRECVLSGTVILASSCADGPGAIWIDHVSAWPTSPCAAGRCPALTAQADAMVPALLAVFFDS